MNSRIWLKQTFDCLSLFGSLKVLSGVGVLILIGVSLKDLSSGLLDLRQHIVVALLFAIVVDTLMVVAKVTQAKAKKLITTSKVVNPEHLSIKKRAGRLVLVTACISAYMNAKAFSSQLIIPDDVLRLTEIPFLGYPFKEFPLVGESFARGIPLYAPLGYAIFLGCAVTFLIYLGAKFYEWNLYDPKIGPVKKDGATKKRKGRKKPVRRTSSAKKTAQ